MLRVAVLAAGENHRISSIHFHVDSVTRARGGLGRRISDEIRVARQRVPFQIPWFRTQTTRTAPSPRWSLNLIELVMGVDVINNQDGVSLCTQRNALDSLFLAVLEKMKVLCGQVENLVEF